MSLRQRQLLLVLLGEALHLTDMCHISDMVFAFEVMSVADGSGHMSNIGHGFCFSKVCPKC